MVTNDYRPESRPVVLGPRLIAEIGRRIHELESRHKPSPRDQRELTDLREFLAVTAKGRNADG